MRPATEHLSIPHLKLALRIQSHSFFIESHLERGEKVSDHFYPEPQHSQGQLKHYSPVFMVFSNFDEIWFNSSSIMQQTPNPTPNDMFRWVCGYIFRYPANVEVLVRISMWPSLTVQTLTKSSIPTQEYTFLDIVGLVRNVYDQHSM